MGKNRIYISPPVLPGVQLKAPLLLQHTGGCAISGQVIGDEVSLATQGFLFTKHLDILLDMPLPHLEISWSFSIGQHSERSCLPQTDITQKSLSHTESQF